MTSFLQPSIYGPIGVSADSQNLMVGASAYVTQNRDRIEELLTRSASIRQWHTMRIVSSSVIASNKWEYTLRLVQPAASPTSTTDIALTELTAVTGYNLAEYGNTASVAGGGVNATRANAAGFNLLAIPNDAFVHAFMTYTAAGVTVALFERMNAWDGECPTALINDIDGGTY